MTSLYAPSSEDVKQRLRPFGFFFEKSLKDLIKGIRNNNETPEKLEQYFTEVLSECRNETTSPDMILKTNAVLKLAYLEMYGFDMSWANFQVLEVMSSNKLQQKRVGYLAASQCFHEDTDVLMLATNLLRKDLKYSGTNDTVKVGIALSGLSSMITPALAADIVDDLFTMLSSSKAYIRKKAVTALFKVFLEYPQALRDNFDKFARMIEDEDLSVISATVSVICELSKKKPEPFVILSPLLYDLLTTIDNNWIIIRLLKLFKNLSQVEEKLRPKLLPKILELMDSTSATSVLYESINCIVRGNMLENDDYSTARACLEPLHRFCESTDPNLRYISCTLFYRIGKINPYFLVEYSELIIKLLTDVDISIRSKALELLEGIINEDNIRLITTILMRQFVDEETVSVSSGSSLLNSIIEVKIVIPEAYKVKIIKTILKACAADNYKNIPDFEWYNAVLKDLTIVSQDMANKKLGETIGENLRDILVRVPDVRDITISNIIDILFIPDIEQQLGSVLRESIWCIGEFASYIENSDDLIRLLVQRGKFYSSELKPILIQSVVKIFASWVKSNNSTTISEEILTEILHLLIAFLQDCCNSGDFDVQERAFEFLELLKICDESRSLTEEKITPLMSQVLPGLFSDYELNPIAVGSQKLIEIEPSIDLQTPFLSDMDWTILKQQYSLSESESINSDNTSLQESDHEVDNESGEYISETDRHQVHEGSFSEGIVENNNEGNPFYLGKSGDIGIKSNTGADDLDTSSGHIPIAVGITMESESKMKKANKKKKKVTILSDEVVGQPQNAIPIKVKRPMNIETSKSKINLKKQTKLDLFDFDNGTEESHMELNPNEYGDDEVGQEELEKLREKFGSHSIENSAAIGNDDEVVTIKKKKKKKKKTRQKDDNLDKKKDKKESSTQIISEDSENVL
ncbi:AP-3 complex subunit delta [Nakaseomyces glabratus]|uniref:AP-3 complex subunit delta n=1 Tax=Candida glabrata TaxID=5478 RepID=A0A0W0D2W0_CANGB|nr:Adaptin N terminal region [Nakaseomyces glabratus]KAH7602513.1 Adaptin N terminal region [Nakaseomyces glabratus]KAH7613903.1 Adaptin N terminal region [Nakaseomyces glabratus]KAI8397941.1 Adaptin N terminal region [Nakaseomyces glabratus]KTA96238.1 AP-3 complex subunit delta [Nakaseomyces glabratus]